MYCNVPFWTQAIMTYPISEAILSSVTSYSVDAAGIATFAGYGMNNSCGSNGTLYSGNTFNTATHQLGNVRFLYNTNCIGIWIVGKDSQPTLDRYDCLNGSCVFNSNGKYSSLSECQFDCGGSGNSCNPPNICVSPDYCPPGMVCIPSAEWSQIEGLASAVENAACSG